MQTTLDTIVALASPAGQGAISILRLSGTQAFDVLLNMAPNLKPAQIQANAFTFTHIQDAQDNTIDECIVLFYRAPHSYTGEDMVEINFHASSYIAEQMLNLATSYGARLAQAGEFTQRAFLNGKMDLSQAESVADLIAAEHAGSHRLAMHQLKGGIKNKIEALRAQLIQLASLMELELDFSEEDVEFADRSQMQALLDEVRHETQQLIASFDQGNAVKEGIPIVIIGKPNAGKSTLLNQLLQEQRALVSEVAGTTRDTIEEVIYLDGIKIRLIDTAGLHDTIDQVEQMGIQRSFKKIEEATLILYIYDQSEYNESEIKTHLEDLGLIRATKELIILANKADQVEGSLDAGPDVMSISAQDENSVLQVKQKIVEKLMPLQRDLPDVVLTNRRHVDAFKQAEAAFAEVAQGLASGLSTDLLTIPLKHGIRSLGEVTQEVHTDDLLESIFRDFCIGK